MHRRGALILSFSLLALAIVFAGPYLAWLRPPVCGGLALIALERISPGCAILRQVRAPFAQGEAALKRRAFREALGHFRTVTALAPDFVPGQLARGEAAQVLGEYAEAAVAYREAAIAGAPRQVALRVADMADRLGDTDTSLRWLETAGGTDGEHAWVGARAAALGALACVGTSWSSPGVLLGHCLPLSRRTYRYYAEA